MPSWSTLVRRLFRKWPQSQHWAIAVLDPFYRVALLPFRRPRHVGAAHESHELTARTEAFNEAAERYYASYSNRQFLLDKPFSDSAAIGDSLIDAGVLINALRLMPGDTILELGAGSCWLSQMLNRCGCRTIAVDVSPTALALGKTLFERDSRTNWTLAPAFVAYDGHRLPLTDASCDSIVINDAFHHFPNQRELLVEMHRVLRSDGLVAMSEPGRGHGTATHSIRESAEAGVLENELVLEDVAALAIACGFSAVNVIAASPLVRQEVPAREMTALMSGKGFPRYWKSFCTALESHHYVVCYKGSGFTTRRPNQLAAAIELDCCHAAVSVRPGTSPAISFRITNNGDTRWLCAEQRGWTRLGAHLYTAADPNRPVDYDWFRCSLPADVTPGDSAVLTVQLPPLSAPGSYVVEFDLVIEGVMWFADRGSPVARVALTVT